jgi:hypothetical protein
VIKYESALKADKYILMVHGNAEELAQARSVLVETSLPGNDDASAQSALANPG